MTEMQIRDTAAKVACVAIWGLVLVAFVFFVLYGSDETNEQRSKIEVGCSLTLSISLDGNGEYVYEGHPGLRHIWYSDRAAARMIDKSDIDWSEVEGKVSFLLKKYSMNR